MPRSTLGTVVGRLLAAVAFDDPMSDAVGFHPSRGWIFREIAREHGWSLAEISYALDARGISHRWQYFSGIGHALEGETQS